MGDTNTTGASNDSNKATLSYTSDKEQTYNSQATDAQEQLSLVEKTRFGLSSYNEEKDSLSDISPLHAATPVKTSLTPEQVRNSAGALLRYHRERLGYSIQEMSVFLKVRTSTVADLENDQLAQETAVNFTQSLLRRYAKLLNLDANTVVDLYMQKVNSIVKISQERTERSHDNHMMRSVVIVVLILLVAGVGSLFAFLGDDKSQIQASNQEVTGVLSTSEDDELKAGMELPMEKVTGDLAIDAQGEATEVTGSIESSEEKPAQPLSANTLKAQAQAEALSAESQKSEVESADNQPSSLPLNEETIERQKAEAAKQAQVAQQAKEQGQEQIAAEQAQKATLDSQNALQTQDKLTTSNQGQDSANKSTDKAESTKTASATESTEPNEATPSLAKSLKDISSQVKVVDRDESSIPSLNQVEISVLKDVALEVRANGKSLKSGVFKSGEKINLNSIPPFTVSVSDTSAVRINYFGGVLQMPNAAQVSFELPTK